jgi:hypothetical protein
MRENARERARDGCSSAFRATLLQQQQMQQKHKQASKPPAPQAYDRRGVSITGDVIDRWDALVARHKGESATDILRRYLPPPDRDPLLDHFANVERLLAEAARDKIPPDVLEPLRLVVEAQRRARSLGKGKLVVARDQVRRALAAPELELRCSDGACKGQPVPCAGCQVVHEDGTEEPCAACRTYYGPAASVAARKGVGAR